MRLVQRGLACGNGSIVPLYALKCKNVTIVGILIGRTPYVLIKYDNTDVKPEV